MLSVADKDYIQPEKLNRKRTIQKRYKSVTQKH